MYSYYNQEQLWFFFNFHRGKYELLTTVASFSIFFYYPVQQEKNAANIYNIFENIAYNQV